MKKKLRTKSQIKVDRLFSSLIGMLGLFGCGYYISSGEIIRLVICFIAIFFLIRVDKCNNDLEYGRYKKVRDSEGKR